MRREWTERWLAEGRKLRPDGWPVDGDMHGRFCQVCHSHFCPHAKPWLYPEPPETHTEARHDDP